MCYLNASIKKNFKISSKWVWALWCMPVISKVGMLRHEDGLFDVSIHTYLMRTRPVSTT